MRWARVFSRTCAIGWIVMQLSCQRDRDLGDLSVTEIEPRIYSPMESTGDVVVAVSELWARELGSGVNLVTGLASWGDGVFWVSTFNPAAIWELNLDRARLRSLLEWWPMGEDGMGTPFGMSRIPGAGLVALGRNGVRAFGAPADRGRHLTMFYSVYGYARGIVGLPDGGFVVSGGRYPDDPLVANAIHEYDAGGAHVSSWHPAHENEDWRMVLNFSGRPIALTADGGLLVSELAPLRITKYSNRGLGDGQLFVEDTSILSESVFAKAMPRSGTRTFFWDRSVFVDELADGVVLNAVHVFPPRREEPRTRFVAVSPGGEILGITTYDEDMHVIGTLAQPNRYLVARGQVVSEVEL